MLNTESILFFLLDVSVKSSLILLIAWAAAGLLAKSSASRRHGIWTLAVATILILPLAQLALPKVNIPLFYIEQQEAAVSEENMDGAVFSLESTNFIESSFPIQKAKPIIVDSGWLQIISHLPVSFWVIAIWLIGTITTGLIILFQYIYAAVRIHRADAMSTDWLANSSKLQLLQGIRNSVNYRKTDAALAPFLAGVISPYVILPSVAERWDEEQRDAVLFHELAHIKRNDLLTQFLVQIASIMQWFNPLIWIGARQMLLEREKACDDVVLAKGIKPSNYAEILLAIGNSIKTISAVAPMARQNKFKERVMAILDKKTNRHTPGVSFFGLAMLVAMAILITISTVQPWATNAQDKAQDKDTYRKAIDVYSEASKQKYEAMNKADYAKAIALYREARNLKNEVMSEAEYDKAVDVYTQARYRNGTAYSKDAYRKALNLYQDAWTKKKSDADKSDENDTETWSIKGIIIELPEDLENKFNFIWPLEEGVGYISSHVAYKKDPFSQARMFHRGIDISVKRGEPIFASEAGVVVLAEDLGSPGISIVIDHGDEVKTSYNHLQELKVQEGDRVEKGDTIGLNGSTGKSTGPHLHFELRYKKDVVDPRSLFTNGPDQWPENK